MREKILIITIYPTKIKYQLKNVLIMKWDPNHYINYKEGFILPKYKQLQYQLIFIIIKSRMLLKDLILIINISHQDIHYLQPLNFLDKGVYLRFIIKIILRCSYLLFIIQAILVIDKLTNQDYRQEKTM